jgi:hypothetical protein
MLSSRVVSSHNSKPAILLTREFFVKFLALDKLKSLYKVIYFSEIPYVNKSLHLDITDNITKRSRNIDSIVDLFLLAYSHNLLGSTPNSGYYILAKELIKNWEIRDLLFS